MQLIAIDYGTKNVGIAVGLVNGGLELAGLGIVLGPAKQLLIRATLKEVNKSLRKYTMQQVLRTAGTTAFRNLSLIHI